MLAGYIILTIVLIISLAGDIRNYRVANLPVALALAAGLILNLVKDGLPGFLDSLLAAIIPAVLLFALFALRMLGAGDIKLFCAIGAIMGVRFIISAMAFSFLAGGIIAMAIMLTRGSLPERVSYIYTYLKTCYLTHSLTQYTDFKTKPDGAKFHFTYAIAAGCLMRVLTFFIPV